MEAHHPAHETSIHHIRSFHVVPSARFGKIELITSAHVVRSLSLAASAVWLCPGRCSTQQRWCAVHFDAVRNVPGCLSHCHTTALPVGSDSHGFLHMLTDLGGVNSKPVGLPAVNELKSKRPAPLSKCSNNAALQSEWSPALYEPPTTGKTDPKQESARNDPYAVRSHMNHLQCKCIRLAAAVTPFDVLSKTREVTKDEIRSPSASTEDRPADRPSYLPSHTRTQASSNSKAEFQIA